MPKSDLDPVHAAWITLDQGEWLDYLSELFDRDPDLGKRFMDTLPRKDRLWIIDKVAGPIDVIRWERLAQAKAKARPFNLVALLACRDAAVVAMRGAGWTYELMAVVLTYAPFTMEIKTTEAKRYRYYMGIMESHLKLKRPTPDEKAAEEGHREHIREEAEAFIRRRNSHTDHRRVQ